jgi:hypothetical protein
LHKKSGDRAPQTERAPADGDLDNMAEIDAEFVETDVGTGFPPRPDMRRPLIDLLRAGPLSSQTIEYALAKRFCITNRCERHGFKAIVRLGVTTSHGYWSISVKLKPVRSNASKANLDLAADRWAFIA